ncbi:MAG: TRAP transporter large permease subunit [Betaproteobacteria bacterium]|nr:TRAP transporter large permease subunit [Betaproteobacteria bacterium]
MSESVNIVLPHWVYWGWLAIMPLIFMWLTRKGDKSADQPPTPDEETALQVLAEEDPALHAPGNVLTRAIDWVSEKTGLFVALWTVNAVCAYFYEVVSRYIFDAPTIWVHQASYLMFGMQYVIAGAYALLHGDHVRVDVIYVKLSKLGQIGLDIFTSAFFFMFSAAMLGTSWTFFWDSLGMREVTDETWRIQFYPIKATMVLGAVLLTLAGLSRLVKDIQLYRLTRRANADAAGRSQSGKIGTYVLIGAMAIVVAVTAVELVNILFYDPWGDTHFLFTLSGVFENMDVATLTILMFVSLAILLMMGLPMAFVVGGLGVVWIYLVGGQTMLNIIPTRIFPLMANSDLAAIPLFIFMASMLERAGLIEEMFDVVYKWMGGLRGGLAAATIVASTILAAMVGVIGAAVVTMGIIALPAMLKRKYDPQIALGSIMAGGTLGILIPPSILAILYAVVAQQSVGRLYLGSVLPGLMLSGTYILYVLVRTWLKPSMGPALPVEERVNLPEKLRLVFRLAAPVALVFLVLGLLFAGIATPVEAAGIGSFGAMAVAAMHKRFSLQGVREASITTARASAMVLWIIFGASIFVGFFILQGGQQFITESILGSGLSPYGILLVMMVMLIFLGMFLDWVGILLLTVPIFVPIIKGLAFGGAFGMPAPEADDLALWFGVLFLVNMQMSFLSPPFGYALFYIRGVCPPEISMGTIFRSSIPFLIMQLIGLILCILVPGIVTWLPDLVYGAGS